MSGRSWITGYQLRHSDLGMLLGKPAGLRVAIDGDVLIDTLVMLLRSSPCPIGASREALLTLEGSQERLTRAADVDESSTQAQGEYTGATIEARKRVETIGRMLVKTFLYY